MSFRYEPLATSKTSGLNFRLVELVLEDDLDRSRSASDSRRPSSSSSRLEAFRRLLDEVAIVSTGSGKNRRRVGRLSSTSFSFLLPLLLRVLVSTGSGAIFFLEDLADVSTGSGAKRRLGGSLAGFSGVLRTSGSLFPGMDLLCASSRCSPAGFPCCLLELRVVSIGSGRKRLRGGEDGTTCPDILARRISRRYMGNLFSGPAAAVLGNVSRRNVWSQ